jgi:hypothetical protein
VCFDHISNKIVKIILPPFTFFFITMHFIDQIIIMSLQIASLIHAGAPERHTRLSNDSHALASKWAATFTGR